MSKVIEKIRHEVVVVGGAVVTVGEAVLQVLPAGSVTTALQVALPALAAFVVRAKTVPLSKFEQKVAQIIADLKPKPKAKKPAVAKTAAKKPAAK